MYPYTLRAAASSSSSTGLGFALGRIGGGGGAAAPGLVVPVARGTRSVFSTPAGNAPVPGDQGVGMEQPKQQQPQVPPQDAAAGGDENKRRDDMHKTIIGDVMTLGVGYSTRSDEEGFGGVYGGSDPVEHPGTEVHPSHPEYDTLHVARSDVMIHSFGVAYSTRSDDEGFGGVYGGAVEHPGTEIHPSHPEDDTLHVARSDLMTHSFGVGYSTRSDEEGFGGVYGGNDPVEHPGTEIHPSHPEYDTSQGSEVKEKEKARHLKDEQHATA